MRLFLDSNILFSAAHRQPNRFLRLWSLPGVEVVTCSYCIGEVTRNLQQPAQMSAFRSLLSATVVVADCPEQLVPKTIMLPAKDLPVLASAIHCGADILLTGDRNHFSRFFGHREAGVLIESPQMFWDRFDPLPF